MNKVDQYALSLFSRANQALICASLDPVRNLVLWMLPNQGTSSTVFVAFNWDLSAFSELDPPAMVTSAGTFAPVASLTLGYTTDGLDVLGLPTDQLTAPMDSRTWTGGTPSGPGYFDASNRLNYFQGPPMAAEVDTGQIDGGAGRRLFCGGLRPIADEPTLANLSTQVLYTDIPNQLGTATAPATPAADGVSPHRISARYMSARVRTTAGGNWTHLQGVEVRVRPEGYR
jgi:hypothetical protein